MICTHCDVKMVTPISYIPDIKAQSSKYHELITELSVYLPRNIALLWKVTEHVNAGRRCLILISHAQQMELVHKSLTTLYPTRRFQVLQRALSSSEELKFVVDPDAEVILTTPAIAQAFTTTHKLPDHVFYTEPSTSIPAAIKGRHIYCLRDQHPIMKRRLRRMSYALARV